MIGIFIRVFACIAFLGICFYSYLDMQNEITHLRIYLPKITEEVRRLEEENIRFTYKIQAFENPEHLMHLAKNSEFASLQFPTEQEVVTLTQAQVLFQEREEFQKDLGKTAAITFAISSNP